MCLRKRNLVNVLIIAAFLYAISFVDCSSAKENYPTRPITVVYGFAAGGVGDLGLRALCKIAEKELGQPLVVENRIGATGTIAMNNVLKAKADGYTLGCGVTSNYIITPHLRKLPYNPITDSPIDIVTLFKYNYALAVKSDSPWNTFEDVLLYAKNNPGKFSYGTAGIGVPQHIMMEQIAEKNGIKWTIVPFKNSVEPVLACAGGHVNAAIQAYQDLAPQLEIGKLKLLLVLDDKRWSNYPNIPVISEKGVEYIYSCVFIYAPNGLPEFILEKLNRAFENAKRDPSFTEILKKFRVDLAMLSGKEYGKYWQTKYAEMESMIKKMGLQEQ